MKPIENKYLYLLDIDTTDKSTKKNGISNYPETYFYKDIIKTNKKFDLIIVAKSTEPSVDLPYYDLLLCSISPKTGKIIDKIIFSSRMIDFFWTITSNSSIDKDLSVKVNIVDSTTDEPHNNIYYYDIYTTKLKYSITDNGIFELKDSVKTYQSAEVKVNSEETLIDSSATTLLKQKLSAEEFDSINKVVSAYNNCNSASQIEYIINQEADFLNILNNKIFYNYDVEEKEIDTLQNIFKDFIPFIYIDYGYEGCCIDATYNYYSIYEKALETPDKDDDIFFDAYESMNKKISNENGTFFSDWNMFFDIVDFETSYSKLGNGNFLNAFKTIQNSKTKTTLFSKQFDRFKLKLFRDLIFNGKFYYSKKEVLDELNSISSEIDFDKSDKQELNGYINKINNLPNTDFNMGDE